jgi:hypothetical protein
MPCQRIVERKENSSMCRKVSCASCSLATWQGCGQHIDSALNGVEEKDRCKGWKTGKCLEKEEYCSPTEAGGKGGSK